MLLPQLQVLLAALDVAPGLVAASLPSLPQNPHRLFPCVSLLVCPLLITTPVIGFRARFTPE